MRSMIRSSPLPTVRSVKVEDLLQALQSGIGALTGRQLKELRHLCLPARVDLGRVHTGEGSAKGLGLEITDEQSVVAQEERVTAPTAPAERLQHLRPDRPVTRAVFLEPIGTNPEQEADSFHGLGA